MTDRGGIDRDALVASLPHGPRNPVAGTPPRPAGSVRRTTAVDQQWGDVGRPQRATGSGRDLLTRTDGTTEVLDEARLAVAITAEGTVADVDSDPCHQGLTELVGAPARAGFRARVAEALPDHRHRTTVLYQLLDDLPLAMLIGSYGVTREHPDWNLPPHAAQRLTDVCAGWVRGGTMLGALADTGTFPVPVGPSAPSLASADPLAWHDLPAMAPRSVRRVRRLDLIAGDPLTLQVYFRDSHRGADGTVDVLHEYTLEAAVDPGSLEVRSSSARAHTLPWPECPGAVASAGRVVGRRVDELADLVAAEFVGTSTCTHLNDVLRSVAAVATLARVLG